MINIQINAFENGEKIPQKFTCDGEDISPALEWNNFPEHTISFAVLCEDPDASSGLFTHWIIFNIPADVMELPENIEKKEKIQKGIIQGLNSSGFPGYSGPCPPEGPAHRYFFKIYALDKKLNLSLPVKRDEFLKALNENV